MILNDFEAAILLLIWLSAVFFMLSALYFSARLQRHIQPGRRFVVNFFWLRIWAFSKAAQYVTAEGALRLRQLRRSLFLFLGTILVAFAYYIVLYAIKSAVGALSVPS